MAVNTSKVVDPKEKKDKPQAKLPVVIAAVILLVVYLGWLGHRVFGPPPPPHTAAMIKNEEFMRKITRQAGPTGDLSKVNPVDRQAYLDEFKGAPVDPNKALHDYIARYGYK